MADPCRVKLGGVAKRLTQTGREYSHAVISS